MTVTIFRPIALLIICSLSCVPMMVFPDTVGPRYDEGRKPDCITSEGYSYKYEYQGYYRGYQSTIHSQIALTDGHHAADDVAEIGFLVVQEAKKRFPRVEGWRHKALSLMMQHTHVIVTVDYKYLKPLWKRDLGKTLVARTTLSSSACFQPQNNTWFYTITAKGFETTCDTPIHEAMHIASYVLHGDLQPDHDSSLYWDEHNPFSLQQLVEDEWVKKRPGRFLKQRNRLRGIPGRFWFERVLNGF